MYKVLLADDIRLSLASEKDFLEGRNLKVFATSSAVEAGDLAAIVQPDLIVLDYEMPEMTGAEICERIKSNAQTAHIPVLIVTVHEEDDIATTCEKAGAVGLLPKAAGREALLEEVARILGVPRRRDVRVPCQFTVGIASGGQVFSGLVDNISSSGVFLTVSRPFTGGLALRLSFDLPAVERPVRLLGEVMRTVELSPSTYGLGIQFLEMDSASRKALTTFLENSL